MITFVPSLTCWTRRVAVTWPRLPAPPSPGVGPRARHRGRRRDRRCRPGRARGRLGAVAPRRRPTSWCVDRERPAVRAVLRPDRPAGPARAALALRAPPRGRGLPRLRTARLRAAALGAADPRRAARDPDGARPGTGRSSRSTSSRRTARTWSPATTSREKTWQADGARGRADRGRGDRAHRPRSPSPPATSCCAPARNAGRARPPGGAAGGRRPACRYWDESGARGRAAGSVVGAGLTAAHLVTGALDAGREVHWVIRESGERYQCADVNSTFFRPEGRKRFDSVGWADRLDLMGRFRRASIMFEFRPRFERAEAERPAHRAPRPAVERIRAGIGGRTVVRLGERPGRRRRPRRARAGHHAVDRHRAAAAPRSSARATAGRPWTSGRWPTAAGPARVRWSARPPGMVLGPAARNIDGHRVATARVAAAVAAGARRRRPRPTEVVGV